MNMTVSKDAWRTCDRCGFRQPAKVPHADWSFTATGQDYCAECTRKREIEALRGR